MLFDDRVNSKAQHFPMKKFSKSDCFTTGVARYEYC